MLAPQVVEGEGSGQPTKPQNTLTTASPSHIEPIPISSGPTTLLADKTVHEERGDNEERDATTATSLDAEQGSGNINRAQSMATLNEPLPQGTGSVNTLRSGEDSMKLNELMEICTKLSERVLALENIKIAQDLEITNLKKREDASKHGRNEIDQDEGISWFPGGSETQGRYGHDIGVNTGST
ncbi:hypothetical protein Tco_0035731, partial [Tanacetum coccineum]